MYEAKYSVRKYSDGTQYTNLKAKFRFRKDVAPKDREEIATRINSGLRSYLEREEGCRIADKEEFFTYATFIANTKGRINCRKIVYFRSFGPFSGPGFNIKVSCEVDVKFGDIRLEEMLDLDALNSFILTGKNPKEK